MNKLTIPALLLGVVMIAGAFAFMPVQEASTVHTTGITVGATTTTTTVAFATAGDLVFNCGADSGCVIQEIYLTGDGTTTSVLTSVTLTTSGGAIVLAANIDDIAADTTTESVVDQASGAGTGFPIVIPAGDSIAIAAADGANGDVTVTIVTSGVVTIDATGIA